MQTSSSFNHRKILVIGLVLCSLVFPLHHFIAYTLNDGHYTVFASGNEVSDNIFDQTFQYATAARIFMNSQRLIVEDLREYANLPTASPVLPPILIAVTAKLLGSLDLAWVIWQWFSLLCIWAFVYVVSCKITNRPWYSFAISWAVCLISYSPQNLFLIGELSRFSPLEISRMASPSPAFAFFLGALYFFSKSLANNKKSDFVSAVILLGLLFYVYYFYWVALYGVVALLSVVFLVTKDIVRLKKVLLISFLALLIGLPYLIVVQKTIPYNLYFLERVSRANRNFSLPGIFFIIGSLTALYFYFAEKKKRNDESNPLRFWILVVLISVVGGAGIGLNFQVISGRNANHEAHYYSKVLHPIIFLLSSVVVVWLKHNYLIWLEKKVVFLTILLVAFATYRQSLLAFEIHKMHDTRTPINEALRWVQKNIPPDKVIGSTNGQIIVEMPAVSGNFNYVPMALRTRTLNNDIIYRYLFLEFLQNKNVNQVIEDLRSFEFHRLSFWYILIADRWHDWNIPEIEVMWKNIQTGKIKAPLSVDYIFMPKNVDPQKLRQYFHDANIVYENQTWSLYKLSKEI